MSLSIIGVVECRRCGRLFELASAGVFEDQGKLDQVWDCDGCRERDANVHDRPPSRPGSEKVGLEVGEDGLGKPMMSSLSEEDLVIGSAQPAFLKQFPGSRSSPNLDVWNLEHFPKLIPLQVSIRCLFRSRSNSEEEWNSFSRTKNHIRSKSRPK